MSINDMVMKGKDVRIICDSYERALSHAKRDLEHQRELVAVLCTKVSLYNLHKGRWMTKNEVLAWAESQIKARAGEGKG